MTYDTSIKEGIKVGITGSIGTGKTTVANIFRKLDYPVWSADTCVHNLYKYNERGYKKIEKLFPTAISYEGVDRKKLLNIIETEPAALNKINAQIWPLVKKNKERFYEKNKYNKIVLFEIPLLYETLGESWVNFVIVVTASDVVQRRRVLARTGMTKVHFDLILEKQLSTEEKIEKADFVINTDVSRHDLYCQVKNVSDTIANSENYA